MTKNLIIVPPTTTLSELRNLFKKYKFRNIFIGDSNRFLGIIGRNYLFSHINESNLHSTVDRIMFKGIVTIDENAHLNDAIQIIKTKNINGLGVTKNGRPCGVITRYDILKKYNTKSFDSTGNRERKKMAICYYCNKPISGMPYICRKCGKKFCGNHQIPESHHCPGLVKNPPTINPHPKPGIPELLPQLTSPTREVRRNAAAQLDKKGWTPTTELEKVNFYFAYERWEKLVKLGSPALNPLLSGLRDQDVSIQEACVKYLGDLRNPAAIEPLIQKLNDKRSSIKIAAGIALGKFGWMPEKFEDKIYFLVANNQWNDLKQLGAEAVDPLLIFLSRNLKGLDWSHRSEVTKNIIKTLGDIQDVRAWNPLVDMINTEKSQWPNEQIFDAIKKIDERFNEQKQKSNLFCIRCFHRFLKYPQPPSLKNSFHQHHCNITEPKISIPILNSRIFSVCRNCKSNKDYIENVKKVVLILEKMDKPYIFENGVLYLNWFHLKRPVDFDMIAILSATNEDVAELVMKLKNDEDIDRRKKYNRLPVYIAKELGISQAKINLLKKTFENVHTDEKNTITKLGELTHVRLDTKPDDGD